MASAAIMPRSAPVGHQADPSGAEAGAQALGHGPEPGDVDGGAGPEEGAERPVGAVQHDAEDDLARWRPVSLRVAVPAAAAALALEPERGGVEEGDADRAEQLTPMREQCLLDQLGAGPAALGLPTEPGDRLVEPAQAEALGAGDTAVRGPGLGMAVRARDHEAMQHRGIHRTLEVEGEAALRGHAPQHRAAAGLLPEPAKDEIGADALPPQRRELALVEGGEDEGAAGVACG